MAGARGGLVQVRWGRSQGNLVTYHQNIYEKEKNKLKSLKVAKSKDVNIVDGGGDGKVERLLDEWIELLCLLSHILN